jgi:hypothetical protein
MRRLRDECEWSRTCWCGPGRLSRSNQTCCWGRPLVWYNPESESEVIEAPLCTVGAMCKANWPTQQHSTEAEWILESVATRDLEEAKEEASLGGGHRVAKGVRGLN